MPKLVTSAMETSLIYLIERGAMVISAKVTERIMPGVVAIPEGAWYAPDACSIDKGWCVNVLTRDEHSPGGAFCSNTALVRVERA